MSPYASKVDIKMVLLNAYANNTKELSQSLLLQLAHKIACKSKYSMHLPIINFKDSKFVGWHIQEDLYIYQILDRILQLMQAPHIGLYV